MLLTEPGHGKRCEVDQGCGLRLVGNAARYDYPHWIHYKARNGVPCHEPAIAVVRGDYHPPNVKYYILHLCEYHAELWAKDRGIEALSA